MWGNVQSTRNKEMRRNALTLKSLSLVGEESHARESISWNLMLAGRELSASNKGTSWVMSSLLESEWGETYRHSVIGGGKGKKHTDMGIMKEKKSRQIQGQSSANRWTGRSPVSLEFWEQLKKQEDTTQYIFSGPLLASRSCALDPLCDLSLGKWYYYCHFTDKKDEAVRG